MRGRRRRACWSRSRTRSTGCCARTRSCPGSGSASCWSRWAVGRARRSSMTTCARSARCSRRRAGRFSGRSTGRARSASSMSGSRGRRSRSGTARRAGLGGRSRAWATRAPARACSCSPSRPRICWPGSRAACSGWARCRRRWSGIARPASTATAGARRTRSPAFCGQLKVGWRFCEPADPQAKGAVERLQGYAETNFEPGRVFANELDFQDQLDAWFDAGQRAHAQDAARAPDRPAARRARAHDGAAGRAARHRAALGHAGRAGSLSAPGHQRLLARSRGLVGQRVEVRVDQREVTAVALDTGEIACRHTRVFARHRRSPRSITPAPCATAAARRPRRAVEVRPLARYDALIA